MNDLDHGINSTFKKTLVTILSLLLLMGAMILSVVSVINPSWQVVDIREFRAEHHHGLWIDCTKSRHPAGSFERNDRSLHCTYKFDQHASEVIDQNIDDIDGSSAANEATHHQFFFWQKACLVCIAISLITGLFGLISGTCSSCSPSCALIFSILALISFIASTVATIIFFFAAHRVDNRFVQGLVGTYEQTIGSAFYTYMASTSLFLLSTVISVAGAYQSLLKSSSSNNMEEMPRLFALNSHNGQLY